MRGELLVDICNRCAGRVEEEVPAAAVVGVTGREGPGAGGLVKEEDELIVVAARRSRVERQGEQTGRARDALAMPREALFETETEQLLWAVCDATTDNRNWLHVQGNGE